MREGWTETTLGEVLMPILTRAEENAGFEVLSVTEKRGIIPQTEVFNHRIATDDISKYKVLQPGDIAFNPYLLWCGAVGQWKGNYEGVVSPVYECFRARETESPRFLGMLFESGVLAPYFDSTAIGSIVRRRRTTLPVFYDAPILRPSLVEQRRIVDVVSTVDAYIDALQQQADTARTARNAVLHELLSAGGDDWTETTIGSECVVKGGKRLPKGTPWSDNPTAHPYIRATDFRNGRIDTSNLVYVPEDVWPVVSRYVVQDGDVLITIAGTIGAIALVPSSHVGANLTENAALIRPVSASLDSEFLYLWLLSDGAQRQIADLTIGTTQQKLGLFRIETIQLRLPPLEEQKRIVEIMSSMDDVIQSTEQAVTDAKNLRSGLLSDLLSGEHEIPESYDAFLEAV